MGEISDVVVVVVVLFLFVLAILWFLLPFAICFKDFIIESSQLKNKKYN
jgi:hypothetical protein